MAFDFIKSRKIFYAFSILLTLASIVSLSVFGLRYGIDFTGGSLLKVRFYNMSVPSVDQLRSSVGSLNLDSLDVRIADNNSVLFRFQQNDEATHQAVIAAVNTTFIPAAEPKPSEDTEKTKQDDAASQTEGASNTTPEEKPADPAPVTTPFLSEERFEAVGPSIGKELQSKTGYAMILVLLIMIAYIAFAFRKVSKPVVSWKYGVVCIVALAHDILLTLGVFSLLGRFSGVEVNATIIAALLTILGYSVSDTIVVFDRIRENLTKHFDDNFGELVNHSLYQTLARSINTSLTTIISLIAIYIFGGETIHYFALALIVGLIAGAYSSIFIASPLLVSWYEFEGKRKNS